MKWGAIATALGVGLLAISQFALGALLIVGGIGYIAFESMKRTQQARPDAIEDDVSPADRHLIAPIRKQLSKIEEIVEANGENAGVKIIGTEALNEGKSIYQQCVLLVIEKANSRKNNAQLQQVTKDSLEAETKLATAQTEEEKAIYQTAIDSYSKQVSMLTEREERFKAIGAHLDQAEASLKLIVTQLMTLAQEGTASGTTDDELRTSLSRLQSLGQSLGETGDFLENIK